jgi:hypothetical protein
MFWAMGGVIKTCCCHVLEYMEWLCFREVMMAPTENLTMEKNKRNLGRM